MSKIVVFGCTGNTGVPLIQTLLNCPSTQIKEVVGITSSTTSKHFQQSALPSLAKVDARLRFVEVNIRNENDLPKLRSACEGAAGITICMRNSKDEDILEIRVADAALAAGVPRIVQIGMSPQLVVSRNVNSQGELQAKVREHLLKSQAETVLIGGVYFQDSLRYFVYMMLLNKKLRFPFPSSVNMTFVNCKDIARFTAAALLVDNETFNAKASISPYSDKVDNITDNAGKHWDMSIAGPEVLPYSICAELLNKYDVVDDIVTEEGDVDDIKSYLMSALEEGVADNIANNHLFIGKLDKEMGGPPVLDESLFSLVEGISPNNMDDLIKLKDYIDNDFIHFYKQVKTELQR